jgi:hypothetical protein
MIPELKKDIWKKLFDKYASKATMINFDEAQDASPFGRTAVDNVIDYHKPSPNGKGSQVACLLGQLEDGNYFYLEGCVGEDNGFAIIGEDLIELWQFGVTDLGRALLEKAQVRVNLISSIDAIFLSKIHEETYFNHSMVPRQVVLSFKSSEDADKFEIYWKSVGLLQYKKWLSVTEEKK